MLVYQRVCSIFRLNQNDHQHVVELGQPDRAFGEPQLAVHVVYLLYTVYYIAHKYMYTHDVSQLHPRPSSTSQSVLGLDLPFLPDEVREFLQLETEDQLQPLILAHGVWHPKIPHMAFAPWQR